jgi:hypothetical protein
MLDSMRGTIALVNGAPDRSTENRHAIDRSSCVEVSGISESVGAEELARLRQVARDAEELSRSEHPMVAMAAERVGVIIVELLGEVSPFEFSGPWQVVSDQTDAT